MGTTLGRTQGRTTLGTTAGGSQYTARSLVDPSRATKPALGVFDRVGLCQDPPTLSQAPQAWLTRPSTGGPDGDSGHADERTCLDIKGCLERTLRRSGRQAGYPRHRRLTQATAVIRRRSRA
jgi:hypothetical protein